MPSRDNSNAPRLRQRLADKLPEILIEAGSVLLALLLALTASVWNEHRQDLERADQARAAILAELGANRNEYTKSADAVGKVIKDLQTVAGDPESVHQMSVNIPLALLSEAAWRTAQTTQAFRDADYAWMIRVSRCYELQGMYMQMQWSVLQQLADIESIKIESKADLAKQLLGRIRVLADLGNGLHAGYADLLGTP